MLIGRRQAIRLAMSTATASLFVDVLHKVAPLAPRSVAATQQPLPADSLAAGRLGTALGTELGANRTGTGAHAGRRSASTIEGPLRFGVNYTPSRDWWFVWENWDSASVSSDLAAIAGLGFDHIRIMMPWNAFQPKPGPPPPVRLAHLQELMHLAQARGLDVVPSVLGAHISGHSFIPRWARGNYVTLRRIVDSQVALFESVGAAIGSEPNLIGFDLGNELLGVAPSRDTAQLESWLGRLLDTSERVAPGKLHTVSCFGGGLPQFPFLTARLGPLSVVHAWWFGQASDEQGALVPAAVSYPSDAAHFIERYGAVGRKVWLQEMGAPQITFSGAPVCRPDLAADWLERQVRLLAQDPGIYGVTWWCSHDIARRHQRQFSGPERSLGLIDADGRPKPDARRLQHLIAEYRSQGSLDA